MNQENVLLSQVQTIVNSYSRINKMSGQSFNFFTLLRKENEEVPLHSMFLAELLNPRGSHQQGTLYLDLFLIQLEIEDFVSEGATCLKEYYTGRISDNKTRGGNIDILIRSVKDDVIKIENKIDAKEQENQLLRYHNFKSNGHLIYLTLNGDESSIHNKLKKEEIKYKPISYKNDIKEWLEACIEKSATVPIVRESIVQYLNLVKKLTFQNINKEIIEKLFLDHPESWGLRGDPSLWEELKENMMNISDDLTYFNFQETLEKKLNDLIESEGEINENGQIHFNSYPQGGMSGGYISKEWWEENGIPILVSRLKNGC